MTLAAQKTGIPASLWALTVSAFAIGTTELVVVGLLPSIASDLSISISHTGLLVTLYALGVAIGGPVMTALTSHLPRKKLLLITLLLFIAGNAVAAITPGFIVLIAGRILSGIAHGVFFGIGATVAGNLVPHKRATAIAIMFAGLTVAMVTGVPFGTFIGQHFGWRTTFAGIVLLGFIGLAATYYLLPRTIAPGKAMRMNDQLKIFTSAPVLWVLLITLLVYAGIFTAFTYLSPLLHSVTGFSIDAINWLLLLYGAAIALGNVAGGKWSNRNPARVLIIMLLLQAVVLFVLAAVISIKIATGITLVFMGFFAFGTVPGLQLYIVQRAEKYLPGREDVASSLNIAAFNVGIAAGSFTGSIIINSPLTIRAVPWVGGLFVILAFVAGVISWKKETRRSSH